MQLGAVRLVRCGVRRPVRRAVGWSGEAAICGGAGRTGWAEVESEGARGGMRELVGKRVGAWMWMCGGVWDGGDR